MTFIGDSNFQVLIGEVELGQLPELLEVAAINSVRVNVTSDQQTAVVADGVNIRLDWSRWISEVLGVSSGNATYTIHRTQLNESGDAIRHPEELGPSEFSERIAIHINQEINEFYIEINCVVTVAGKEDPDRAVYELEACVPQSDDQSEQRCFSSNITVYAIEKRDRLGKNSVTPTDFIYT